MTANDERERNGRAGGAHPAQRVEEDHRALQRQLQALATATAASNSGTVALPELLALSKMLAEHFAVEEQVDGFYDDLRRRRPSQSREIDALSAEHRVILGDLDALCRRLQGRSDADPSAGEAAESDARDLARWLERLHNHEREESRLIGDIYYTDEGGHG